ncbi:MAG: hypothetical protein Q9186_006700 [Xanthomendoza sp. 1 TL-2023]
MADQLPHPTATDSINHHGDLNHANPGLSITTLSDTPVQPPKRKRSTSSEVIQSFGSPTALEKHLLEQNLQFHTLSARATSADLASSTRSDTNSDSGTDTTPITMTTNPANIRQELKRNYMYVNSGLLNRPEHARFKERVTKVVRSDRKSVVSDEDKKQFQSNYNTYNLANEATLTYMLVPLIMKPSFTAPDVDDDGNPIGEAKVRWFDDVGVVASMDQLFESYCLPHELMNVPNLPQKMRKDHFDKSGTLKSPKPDFSYGIERDRLPQAPNTIAVSPETNLLLDVAPYRNVFFNWENKSGQGSLAVCENQALMDSSAVILASRELLARIGETKQAGIDEDTYVYAATNNNKLLEVFVAYAWVPSDCSRVEFHMESIASVPFTISDIRDDPDVLVNLRKLLHNIIEWGAVTRMGALKRRYDRLWAWEARRFAEDMAAVAKEQQQEEEAKSAKRKK